MSAIKPTAKSATIAVIDPEVWRVRHVSAVLQSQGHKVLLLSATHNAVVLVSDARCDVVLTVEALGSTSGSTIAAQLREKLGARCPWLVLLSEPGEPISAALRAGFDACVERPIADERVLEVVAEGIAARRAAIDAGRPVIVSGTSV